MEERGTCLWEENFFTNRQVPLHVWARNIVELLPENSKIAKIQQL